MKIDTKKRYILIAAAALLVLAVGIVVVTAGSSRSVQLSAEVGMATPESLYRDAAAIVIAEPTGQRSWFTGGGVRFRQVSVRVVGTLRGEPAPEETLRILQTVGLEADPGLKKGTRYLLFLDPYAVGSVQGMDKAAGAYVVKGAFKGAYPLDARGNPAAIRTSYETEEQTAQREEAMRAIWDQVSRG